jgi:hypothetical protein
MLHVRSYYRVYAACVSFIPAKSLVNQIEAFVALFVE